MKDQQQKPFLITWLILSAIMLVVVVIRAVTVPFCHDEVATFIFYIQPGKFIPFFAHPDANNHVLTSLTSWVTYKLFGSELWSLRLPCIAAYMVLAYAVYRCGEFFRTIIARILFTSFFLLSFNFLAFYALCRGYGFSMSFLLLALYYFFRLQAEWNWRFLLKFLLFSQVALSANLTLVAIVLMLTAWTFLFLLHHKQLFRPRTLLALFLHFGLIFCWAKYALFLQETGALYYGAGDSYWSVTFKTLIETILFRHVALNILVLVLFVLMTAWFAWLVVKGGLARAGRFGIMYCSLVLLIIGFWLLHVVLKVNYPEDRTGLFFYVFFAFSFSLMVSEWKPGLQWITALVPLGFLMHFVTHVNFEIHPWRIYETIPQRFFDRMAEDQKSSSRPLTIAGHRVRELFYNFMNYNSPVKTSAMTCPEGLQMNCDYALAYTIDAPYDSLYYEEVDSEPYWDFRLLKRREKIGRQLLFEKSDYPELSGDQEYWNALEMLDTGFVSTNPLEAEFSLSVGKAPVPLDAWLVLQVDPVDEKESPVFVRVMLNLLQKDWNGTQHFKTSLVSGNIPSRIKRLVVYFWNIEKQAVQLKVENFRLYQLQGNGVNIISKAKL